MPKVVREDIDNLNAVLTVTIDQKAYEPKFIAELKKYRDKGHMRGFRKGKTPINFLKKAYGKDLLSEIVHEMLQEELTKYFQDDKTEFLGQPIPVEDTKAIEFDVRDLEDYIFKFDVGKAPEFELRGLEEGKEFEYYKVEVTNEMVEKELDEIRKRKGERVYPEEDILENDLLQLSIKELEGEALKEDGWESLFSIMMSKIAKEELKKEILSKKKGDTIRVNVFELEDGAEEEFVKKHFLNMTESDIGEGIEVGPFFEATIESVSRIQPAELDQKFFDNYFGNDKVTSEEEAGKEIRLDIAAFYEGQAEGILYRTFRKSLMEANRDQLSLPDAFMKRWLKVSSKKNTDKVIERDYDRFAENLRWSLLKSKLAEKFDIKIEEEDLRDAFRDRLRGYLKNYFVGNPDLFESTIDRLMEDPKQVKKVSEELADDRLFDALKGVFALKEKPVSDEEFNKIVETIKEEDAPPVLETEEEEE